MVDSFDPEIPVDPEILTGLRAWRHEEARTQNVPAFWILSNRTMAEIAARRPETAEDLLRIHGMGRARVDKYGPAILEVVTRQPIAPVEVAGAGAGPSAVAPSKVIFQVPPSRYAEVLRALGAWDPTGVTSIEIIVGYS